MNEASKKYLGAAMAARNLAYKAATPEARASWLQHAEDWERMAEEADPSSNNEDAEDV